MLNSTQEALELLNSLKAPQKLIEHAELVSEAGNKLIQKLNELGIEFDGLFIQIGIIIHDAGKIIHSDELTGKGNLHEPAGEILLLENGVQAKVARCCLSHARYGEMDVSFEELIIALSDKLWKGKREPDLELRVIDAVANMLDQDRWDLFSELDTCFENIAAKGDDRLSRSF